MRIAQIAPLFESVPPQQYGGIERIVAGLCDELTRRGHEVTLFASGDSQTNARLSAFVPMSLRKSMSLMELTEFAPHMHLAMISQVYHQADSFDVIHSHIEPYTFPFVGMVATPTVITAHGTLEPPIVTQVLQYYPQVSLISISMAQRAPVQTLPIHWVGSVYNGLAIESFPFRQEHGRYLAFLGRITPSKRPDRAVEIARRSGMPLKVGAKIDPSDQMYWEQEIKPLFAAHHVEYLGELNDQEKAELLSGAYATVFPIDWAEPFGLVMVESLACGTPVIALRQGSVPEILRDGVSGFICDSVDEMVMAVPRIAAIDRAQCRRESQRFSIDAMVSGYEAIYKEMVVSPSGHSKGSASTGLVSTGTLIAS